MEDSLKKRKEFQRIKKEFRFFSVAVMLEWFSMQLSKMITQKNPEESKKVGKKQRKPSSIIPKEWPKYAKDKNKAPEECCKKKI